MLIGAGKRITKCSQKNSEKIPRNFTKDQISYYFLDKKPTKLQPEKAARMRSEIIKEILVTEKDYVNDLHIIHEVFVFPMKLTGVMSNEDITTVFGAIESLIACNEQLLKDWTQKKTTETDDIVVLCEVFQKVVRAKNIKILFGIF